MVSSRQPLVGLLIDRPHFCLKKDAKHCFTLRFGTVVPAEVRFALRCSYLSFPQLAVCMGTPIVTPSWIHKSWDEREDM